MTLINKWFLSMLENRKYLKFIFAIFDMSKFSKRTLNENEKNNELFKVLYIVIFVRRGNFLLLL